MTPEIALGSVVRLRSGGPWMTVTGTGEKLGNRSGLVRCEWFAIVNRDADGSARYATDESSGVFPVEALEVRT